MRTQHTRDILFYDFRIVAEPQNTHTPTMRDIFRAILELFNQSETEYWLRNKSKKIHIKKCEFWFAQYSGKILLHVNNAHGSSASFADLGDNTQRDEIKRPGEGRPESCHIIISFDESADNSNKYSVLMEDSHLINRATLQVYMNQLMHRVRKHNPSMFKYPDPSGAIDENGPLMEDFQCNIKVLAHLSPILIQDLQQGKIHGVFLETDRIENMGVGEPQRVVPIRKQLKIAIGDENRAHPARFLGNVLRFGREQNYERARIAYEDDGKHQHTATLETDTGSVINKGFMKSVELTATDITLPEASVEFENILLDRMISLATEDDQLAENNDPEE